MIPVGSIRPRINIDDDQWKINNISANIGHGDLFANLVTNQAAS